MSNSPQTFCVIDDEREICDILRLMIESRGHRAIIAYDGQTGLELIKKHLPNAIFLDMQMPNMNGFEVITKLKQDEKTKDIPILVLSGFTEGKSVNADEIALSMGADGFLPKPFDIEDLFEVAEKITGLNF